MIPRIRALAVRTYTALFGRGADHDLDDEIETHLDLLVRENLRRGMEPQEAMRDARIRFGSQTQLKETHRELRGLPLFETFFQDLRYALRMLRKNAGFAAAAIFTLALGIGANTAIFSVVYAVLLKPLPYANANQLFNVFQQDARDGTTKTGWSYLNFEALRDQNRIFSGVAGSQHHQLTLTGHGEPSVVDTSVVTPEFFSVFGQKPLLGRVFHPDDGKRGAAPVAILSEGLWRGSFGADPNVIGSSINLDRRSFTIAGVVPRQFRFPLVNKGQQLWIPLAQDPLFGDWTEQRRGHWLQVTGRLRPGISPEKARAELELLGIRFAQEFPAENREWTIGAVPLRQMIAGGSQSALLVLLGAVGLVLLIACANIANLLLARATSRASEIAIRATLGAGRGRIIRQLLSESALLGVIGGLAGIVLAYAGVRGLSSLLPPTLPRANTIRIDSVVLAFALVLSVAASLAFGLAPALMIAKSSLQAKLREGSARSGESGKSRFARNALAVAEITVATVLLLASGLLLRSFSKLTSVDPGFRAQHLVKAEISLPRFQYSTPRQWADFSERLLTGLHLEPGLRDSAIAIPIPLANKSVNLAFDVAGSPLHSSSSSRTADYVSVSPEYFRVMGVPLVAGRFFDQRDKLSSLPVSVISSAMARVYFPHQNPIGKQLVFAFPPRAGFAHEIVGVVGDVRDAALGDVPGAMMYVPYMQEPFWGANLVIRSTLSTSSVADAVRRETEKIDTNLPVSDVAALPEILDASVAQPKFQTLLLTIFAAIALMLAATGIFGVISYSVSCRTQEIGIRLAVGASRGDILWMVSRHTLILTMTGLAIGIPCALAASHLLGHMLFGISADDPATLVFTAFALALVAAIAGYVPARRATRVDPVIALRYQ